ncbi:hypothetical protein [Bacillus sp. 3255]|uniref:hypothetical protein n=1 Tax=Bacillus sp. 3255 TaxID=2817904 RepID=UPI0028662EE1|nr:hypothetical protein [Bacillus sp. 3255]MDR6883087.1 hypothetical protein [Bacillus sp. 3255]
MKIALVPRVCSQLVDQSNCAKAIELCGVDTNPDVCTAKLIGKAFADPEPFVVTKALYGFGQSTYHFTMRHGHNYLHSLVKDLIQNIGGDGQIGVVGRFISDVLGVQ